MFMPTVCRFADGGDMSPPYRGCFISMGCKRVLLLPAMDCHVAALLAMTGGVPTYVILRRLCRGNLMEELWSGYGLVCLFCLPLRGRRGDACERRLWRRKRARRSGRIKATDKWALPTQTEPLIQQDMSPPYRGYTHPCRRARRLGVPVRGLPIG